MTRADQRAHLHLHRVLDDAPQATGTTDLAEFAAAYADRNEVDHQALVDAIKKGTLSAEFNV